MADLTQEQFEQWIHSLQEMTGLALDVIEQRIAGMRTSFRLILSSWAAQRQRLSDIEIEAMAETYTAGLIDLEPHVLRAAVVRLVRTSKWLPTVAEIVEAASIVKFGHTKTGTDAWGEVIAKMSRYGAYRTPGVDFFFDDPLTWRIVEMLSWSRLCVANPVDLTSARARFIDTYTELAEQERKDAAMRPGIELAAGKPTLVPRERQIATRRPVLTAAARSQLTRQVLLEVIDLTEDPDVKALARDLPALPASTCTCVETFASEEDLGVAEDGRCRMCGAKREP